MTSIARIAFVLLVLVHWFDAYSDRLRGCAIAANDDVAKATEHKPSNLVTLPALDKNRWMVVLCSLGGDDEHEERLSEAVEQVLSAAGPVFGVEPEHVRVLLSSKQMIKAIPGSKACNRESMNELAKELEGLSNERSQHLFFVLGHSHLDGRRCQFNIEGPDIDQDEYAKLFGGLPCKEQVHWIGVPASGYWIKPLTGSNQIIITATEADLEITATEMPYALGALLAGLAEYAKLEDIDGDGQLTLLDLYLSVSIEVHQRFVTQDYLPTEHSQLDDNGDGRGGELQAAYLPKKDGEAPVTKTPRRLLDGDRSRGFLLGWVRAEN